MITNIGLLYIKQYRTKVNRLMEKKDFKMGKFKKNFKPHKPKRRILTKEDKQKLHKLESDVKIVMTAMAESQEKLVNKEPEFKKENLGKKILIETTNHKKIEGELQDIDKYRLIIKTDDKVKYYYKHSIVRYNLI